MKQHYSYYASPELMSVETCLVPELLCSSPAPGGNEDLVLEEWE